MSRQKAIKLLLIAFLIRLVAEGALIAWASPPDATDEEEITPAEPSESGPWRSAASGAVPAANENDANLIGTAVIEGGSSIAVLKLATGIRFVREGDEILPGLRLVKVARNRIDVERVGVLQDIRSRWDSEPVVGGQATRADVENPRQPRSRMARSLFYSRQAQN
jgi:hypothetical protein